MSLLENADRSTGGPGADAPVQPVPGPARRRGTPIALALTAAVAGLGVLIAALAIGHGVEQRPPGDLPYAGAGTAWALPVARFLHDASAVLTVGFLLLAVALIPDRKGRLGPSALAAMWAARISAALWLVAELAEAILNLSTEAAAPVGQILSGGVVWQYLSQVLEGQVSLGILIATVLLVLTPPVRTSNAAAVLLGVALLALLLPPLFTGHSASASNHDLAMTSLTLHVLTATLWAGGLAAITWLARSRRDELAVALPRYSSLALVCFVTVGVSGLVNAAIRLGRLDALWQDRYGLLVIGKALFLVALGLFGYRHRQRTVADAVAGVSGAFRRLAALEIVVLAGAFGLAVALSRSPTPVARSVPDVSIAKAALGYEMPGPVSIRAIALDWQPQLVFAIMAVLGVVGYVRGLQRLRERGDSWAPGRTAAWFGGLLVLVIATQSGLSRYGGVLFSVHMAQHMLLAMVAPPLLALGAPITLALRVLPAKKEGYRSARGWLLAALRSPVLKVLSQPLVALGIFVVSTFALYFSGAFESLMREHTGHLLMELHFLFVGCLLFWPILSPDPLPHRPGHAARLLLLIVTMPFHAFFGLAVMISTTVLAGGWFESLGRTWGSSSLGDQRTGGGLAMALSEPVALLVALAVFMQWSRVDERQAQAIERRAERNPETDELAAYNRYLESLSRRR